MTMAVTGSSAGSATTEKHKRPPRTKQGGFLTMRKFALVLPLACIGLIGVSAFIPCTRWVPGDGYLMTRNDVELRPSVEGAIDQWLVHSGEAVEKDRLLIQLNASVQRADLEQADSDLKTKQAQLAALLSAQDLEKSQRLEQVSRATKSLKLAQGEKERIAASAGFTPKEVEDANLRMELAQSQLAELQLPRDPVMEGNVAVLKEQIDSAQKHLAVADAQLRLRQIRSPIKGFVQLNRFEPGEVVKPDHVLGQVFDRDGWVVKAKLPEDALAHVRIGQPVDVAVSAYPSLRYGYLKATVSRITPIVTPRTSGGGIFAVEAILQPTAEMPVQPGMTATAHVNAGRTTVLYRLMGW